MGSLLTENLQITKILFTSSRSKMDSTINIYHLTVSRLSRYETYTLVWHEFIRLGAHWNSSPSRPMDHIQQTANWLRNKQVLSSTLHSIRNLIIITHFSILQSNLRSWQLEPANKAATHTTRPYSRPKSSSTHRRFIQLSYRRKVTLWHSDQLGQLSG